MADVKRYDIRVCSCDYPDGGLELSGDGDYVDYDDYAALRASHGELLEAASLAVGYNMIRTGINREREIFTKLVNAIAKAERI